MPKFKASNVKWKKQHTDILKRYYMLKSLHPFATVNHFTVTPKGNQISKELLRTRFNNTLRQCTHIYSVLYNYEISEAGVHHIHGILLSLNNFSIDNYFERNALTILSSIGGLKGWIKYMTKDKGKTHSKNRTEPIIQNYL